MIKDLAEVDIDTHFLVSVLVRSTSTKSLPAEQALSDVGFSGTAILSLQTNEDLSQYLDKLRSIDFKSLEVTVYGLDSEQKIVSVSISVAGVGTICTAGNITAAGNTVKPEVDSAKLKNAAKKLLDDRQIEITISGTSSKPIQASGLFIELDFDSVVKAGALD